MIDLTKEEAAALLCSIDLLHEKIEEQGEEYDSPIKNDVRISCGVCPSFNSKTVRCRDRESNWMLTKEAVTKLKSYISEGAREE